MFRSSLLAMGLVLLYGADDPELEKLVKDLRNKEVKVRLKAAESLGKKGQDAAPAARALSDAILDLSPQVATACLEALEKVRPDLYKPLSVLILDKDSNKHLMAIREFGLMGEKATPVVSVLLFRLRQQLSTRGKFSRGLSQLEEAYFTALQQINPDDAETLKIYMVVAGPLNKDGYTRIQAIGFLNNWAAGEETRRRQLLPFLKAGLDDPICQLDCIKILGTYGAIAKDFVPLLKKLKLSKEEKIREAAGAAVDKIENP